MQPPYRLALASGPLPRIFPLPSIMVVR